MKTSKGLSKTQKSNYLNKNLFQMSLKKKDQAILHHNLPNQHLCNNNSNNLVYNNFSNSSIHLSFHYYNNNLRLVHFKLDNNLIQKIPLLLPLHLNFLRCKRVKYNHYNSNNN